MLVKSYICVILMLSTTPAFCQCTALNGSNTGEESAEAHAKKAEYARSIISDTNYLRQQPTCVAAAMKYLGTEKDAAAIPQLVNLLAYRVPTPQCDGPNGIVTGVGTGCGPKGAFPWVKYPAMDAVHRIGKPATAALLQAIGNSDEQSTEGKHALDALMDIYREDVNGGLRLLKRAAAAQTDVKSTSRLENAEQKARLKWCKYARPTCTE